MFPAVEVVFLGTGTSNGVPMIAHDCAGLDMSNPKNWRTRSSIHVNLGGTHIQVDATPEFRLQCIRNEINWIDAFILTHGHADHIQGMDDLRRFCDLLDFSALPVYGEALGLQRVREIYPYAVCDVPKHKGYAAFSLNEMPPVLELPGGQVRGVLLPHPPIETMGLVFTEKDTGSKLVYYNDCKSVPNEALEMAKGADVVVLDGLRPMEHRSHMSIDEAIETAKVINAPTTYLIHMTGHVDHDTFEKKLPEGIHLSWDGLRLNF